MNCPHCGHVLTIDKFPPRLTINGVPQEIEIEYLLPMSHRLQNLFYVNRDRDVERVPLLIVRDADQTGKAG